MKLEVLLAREETASLLEQLADAVDAGRLPFRDGTQEQTLVIEDRLRLTVRAKKGRIRQDVVVSLQWEHGEHEPIDLNISG